MGHVEIGSMHISYDLAGEGPPLVLLHGFFCDRSLWRRQVVGLSDEFTVVAPDLLGCGDSSDPPETFLIADFADSVVSFVGALDLQRPHILGLSLGSVVALELYRQQPELVATLILASAYAGWKGSLSAELVEQRLERTVRQTYQPPAEWIKDWVTPGLLTETATPELVDEVSAMVSAFHPAGARAMTRAAAAADMRDVLSRIRVPTLLIYGDKDVRSPVTVGEEIHKRIAGSELLVIPGVGHVCNVEAPDRFNAEVRRFLRGQVLE